MKKSLLTAVAALLATSGFLTGQTTVTDSLTFTGGIQTYTIPCGVTSVIIECYGAQGGTGAVGGNGGTGGTGGLGGYSTGTLSVVPGQILNVFVGGSGAAPAGGFNGGANGGSQNAAGGGGASDVRVNATALTDRVITAGGGGGGGRAGCETAGVNGGNGGNGGGVAGANGVTSPDGGGGFGGTIAAGGAAGVGCGGFLGSAGTIGTTGNGGVGGAGQSCCCFSFGSIPGGGGGGGGFLGGGGGGGGSAGTTGCSGNNKGGGAGGAGGSNDISGVTSGSTTNGVRTGNGVVKITYTLFVAAPGFTSVPSAVCIGDTVSLSVTSVANTTYTWNAGADFTILSGQGSSSITVVASGSTGNTISVFAIDICGNSSAPAVTGMITINPLPTIAATSMSSTICNGDSDTLLVTGTSSSYLWSTSGTGSMIVVAPTTTTTYTVTGTDVNGCVASTTTTVNVNQLPIVSYSAPGGIICAADGDFSLTGGSPAGGTYSGTAVSSGMFSPTTAGVGSFLLTYSYTDSVGCSASSADTLTVDQCLNIASMSNNSFGLSFMPNPATDVLHVNWDNNKANVSTLEVYDNTGRLVMSKTVAGENRADLDITTLPAGNYTLTVKSATSKENFGFIKK